MRSTAIDRRTFLRLTSGAAAALALPAPLRAAPEGDLYVASVALPGGRFAAIVIDERGNRVFDVPLATRGHDAAVDPSGRRLVLFARRPGRFALVIDIERRDRAPLLFAPPEDRHFNGHGVFAADGRLLYATENTVPDAFGRLGVYDASAGFRRIGEIDTHGIGPHEVVLSPDGSRLVVANGGIATDPENGDARRNLNLPSMEPSLVEIDRTSGDLVSRYALPGNLHQLSIRHLAFDRSATIWFGCQWEGDPVDHPPLVGRVAGGRFDMIGLDRRPLFAARNYVGAVAASRDGERIAASCPRGGMILVFDAATGRLLREVAIDDSSGIAPSGERDFLAASGNGLVAGVGRGGAAAVLSQADLRYDNHLRRIDRSDSEPP